MADDPKPFITLPTDEEMRVRRETSGMKPTYRRDRHPAPAGPLRSADPRLRAWRPSWASCSRAIPPSAGNRRRTPSATRTTAGAPSTASRRSARSTCRRRTCTSAAICQTVRGPSSLAGSSVVVADPFVITVFEHVIPSMSPVIEAPKLLEGPAFDFDLDTRLDRAADLQTRVWATPGALPSRAALCGRANGPAFCLPHGSVGQGRDPRASPSASPKRGWLFSCSASWDRWG